MACAPNQPFGISCIHDMFQGDRCSGGQIVQAKFVAWPIRRDYVLRFVAGDADPADRFLGTRDHLKVEMLANLTIFHLFLAFSSSAIEPGPNHESGAGPRLGGTGTRDHDFSHADRVGSLPLGGGGNPVLASASLLVHLRGLLEMFYLSKEGFFRIFPHFPSWTRIGRHD